MFRLIPLSFYYEWMMNFKILFIGETAREQAQAGRGAEGEGEADSPPSREAR